MPRKADKYTNGSNGHVYILRYSDQEEYCKIGHSENVQKRVKDLNSPSGMVGEWSLHWSCVVSDMRAVESALHYYFGEYHDKKEFFRIRPKVAAGHARKVVAALKPLPNPERKLIQQIKASKTKTAKDKAQRELWAMISKGNRHPFIQEAIHLMLEEERYGEPRLRRFSSMRNKKTSGIGMMHLFVCAEHLRIAVDTKDPTHAATAVAKKLGKNAKVTPLAGGISFYVRNETEWKRFRNWVGIGV
jgi:hypothetical protein